MGYDGGCGRGVQRGVRHRRVSYLARGVVGDLTGFLLLGVAGAAVGARLKHEAIVCLALIGVVLLLDPQWPLRLSEPLWWGLFTIGLAAYVAVRRKICD